MLATSSEKGTVIRVWSVPGAEKLYQFRRGTREARIYCISFNVVGSLMAVSLSLFSFVYPGPGVLRLPPSPSHLRVLSPTFLLESCPFCHIFSPLPLAT
jgi:hypothetical protein